MSCYHPMVLVKTANMLDPKQRQIVDLLSRNNKKSKTKGKSYSTILIPREVAEKEGITLRENKAVLVPCGRCIGCRLDYSRQWAERCVHEAEQYEHNYFLSLTYDDDHLPRSDKTNVATLIPDEVSKFMKALRQKMKNELGVDGIRFFACGEYGEGKGQRLINPHFHIILFNCPLPDLQERHPIKVDGKVKCIYQYADDGEKLLFSKLVASCWNDDKGQLKGTAQIGKVTYESCAYVSRYIVKKQYGEGAKIYKELGIAPEFVRMSRMPGIGSKFYDSHFEAIYEFDKVATKHGDKVYFSNPGKYCDNKLKERDPQRFYEMKEDRHKAFWDSIDCKTYEGVDLATNNLHQELEKLRQSKILKRN